MIRIATRGSDLARWQAEHVASRLRDAHGSVEVELVVVSTTGDRRRDTPIWEMGGKGVFSAEVQAAVLDGRADVAVHSAKDLPSVSVPGLTLAAVSERGDPRDALVGATLADLPVGALVATGSVRRRAQLANVRPDLTFTGLRGNIPTRLEKAGRFGAIVVAAAALQRLGRGDRITEVLEPNDVVPQAAQGALAVECRADDEQTRALLAPLNDPASRRAVDAERGFLAELGGDCNLPAGAYAAAAADGGLELTGLLASLDGHVALRHRAEQVSGDPADLGRSVARYLLDEAGGAALLG